MKSEKRISVRHTPMQRFWGVLAFLALFACGLMVGMGIKSNKNFSASDSDLNINQCEWAERVLFSEMPDEKTYDVYVHVLRLKIYRELEPYCGEKYLSRVAFEQNIIQTLYNVRREKVDLQRKRLHEETILQNALNETGEIK